MSYRSGRAGAVFTKQQDILMSHLRGSARPCIQDTEYAGLWAVSRIVWGWKDFCTPTLYQHK